MKTIVHVNQHVIKANRKNGTDEPCLTVKTYKDNRYVHEAVIVDENGVEVARVVYRPHKPLGCGAHCWIETKNRVVGVIREIKDEEAEYDCTEHDGAVCQSGTA